MEVLTAREDLVCRPDTTAMLMIAWHATGLVLFLSQPPIGGILFAIWIIFGLIALDPRLNKQAQEAQG